MRGIIGSAFFLGYPYLVYQGMEKGVVWFAPSIILGVYLYQGIKTQNTRSRIYKFAIAGVLLAGTIFFQSLTAKLLPFFIQLMLMHFFGHTLFNGPPLIERFVRMEFPELPPGIAQYCRQLTWLWTGFFAFNAIMCLILAFWAPDSWWAIYNGVLIFVLTALLMVGEYIWRHFKFPDLDIPSPKSSAKNMIVNGRKIWLDVHNN